MTYSKLVIFILMLPICSCHQRSLESIGEETTVASGSLKYDLTKIEIETLEKEALTGNTTSAMRLSDYFSFIQNDFESSVRWLRIAANDKNPITIQTLAYYLQTTGGQSNCEESLKLFEQLRDQYPSANEPKVIDSKIKDLKDNFEYCVNNGRF